MVDPFLLPALAEVNSSDICLLLIVSCLFEATVQIMSFHKIRKSESEKEASKSLLSLKYQCAQSKIQGPEAFVETSKLERSILSREKELQEFQTNRTKELAKIKHVSSRLSYVLYAVVAALYWGVPMILLNDVKVPGDASSYLKTYFFPMFLGIAGKTATVGQPVGGLGPLLVVWAGQISVSEFAGSIINILES